MNHSSMFNPTGTTTQNTSSYTEPAAGGPTDLWSIFEQYGEGMTKFANILREGEIVFERTKGLSGVPMPEQLHNALLTAAQMVAEAAQGKVQLTTLASTGRPAESLEIIHSIHETLSELYDACAVDGLLSTAVVELGRRLPAARTGLNGSMPVLVASIRKIHMPCVICEAIPNGFIARELHRIREELTDSFVARVVELGEVQLDRFNWLSDHVPAQPMQLVRLRSLLRPALDASERRINGLQNLSVD